MKLLFSSLRKSKIKLLLCFFTFFAQPCFADMKSPFAKARPVRQEQVQSLNQVVFSGMVLFYSRFISPLDGPRSPSYPTGSAYGLQAIREEGFLVGTLLIGDRLLHEADQHQGAYFRIYGQNRYYDPLENNTFWWKNQ
jgi:putative component of membrane protein insertase Oxa1/YidC/SpoIIIJ protein YidD